MVYPSIRNAVYAPNGMVATSQHLAAQAGLDILRRGGNAIDAAIATAMALTVVEPGSNGLGGDGFAIVWHGGKLYGLNSSGKSPMSISAEKVRALGYDKMPRTGPVAVNVPGIPGAWAALSKRFGSMPMTTICQSAVDYARDGYSVGPVMAEQWAGAQRRYSPLRHESGMEEWFHTFLPDGRVPKAGDIVRLPDHARTLCAIAQSQGEDFYRGELAAKISDHFAGIGGFLTREDLAAFEPEWVEPVSVNYKGCDIWELPPNGHGIVALMALNILKGFELKGHDDPETLHLEMEAIKLAFADGKKYVTDPRCMEVSVKELLSESYAEARRALIGPEAAMPRFGEPRGSGTVYLCAADKYGNMISYIQSNYQGFGSGVVVPGTGIALQNRGSDFSLDPSDANFLMPGKKTYHTIIPGFITKDGAAVGPFGLMGGYMQPQGHVQMVVNMLDFGLGVQQSLDAPRWQWTGGKDFILERGFSPEVLSALRAKGHVAEHSDSYMAFGRGQSIFRTASGALIGATEPRADGAVASY